jgi:hypothetical protein
MECTVMKGGTPIKWRACNKRNMITGFEWKEPMPRTSTDEEMAIDETGDDLRMPLFQSDSV